MAIRFFVFIAAMLFSFPAFAEMRPADNGPSGTGVNASCDGVNPNNNYANVGDWECREFDEGGGQKSYNVQMCRTNWPNGPWRLSHWEGRRAYCTNEEQEECPEGTSWNALKQECTPPPCSDVEGTLKQWHASPSGYTSVIGRSYCSIENAGAYQDAPMRSCLASCGTCIWADGSTDGSACCVVSGTQCDVTTQNPTEREDYEDAAPPSPPQSQEDCPEGTYFGTVNGVTDCYGNGQGGYNNGPKKPVPNDDAPTPTDGWDGSGKPPTPGTGGGTGGGTGPGTGDGTGPGDGGEPCTGEDCPEGPSLGDCDPETHACGGSLWESDYPDGLEGVFEGIKNDFYQTSFYTWLDSWSLPSSGSCPSFTLNFNLGPLGNFGTGDFFDSSMCWIFGAIRAIVIFCALLLFRRLVFGG